MNQDFFQTIEDRRAEYAKRTGVKGADVLVTFHGGRTLVVDRVVDAAEGWLMLEGRDKMDEDTPIAIATSYHQVAAVQFVPQRERIGRTGF